MAARATLWMAFVGLAWGFESETCESIEMILENVEEMTFNHTTDLVAPVGTLASLGHGEDPDARRRLEDTDDNPYSSSGVLGLEPNYLESMDRMGFVLPFDWECQAGTSEGVYPCPWGVPSTCRVHTTVGVSSTTRLTNLCAACACSLDSYSDHGCCDYVNNKEVEYSDFTYYYQAGANQAGSAKQPYNFACPAELMDGDSLIVDTPTVVCAVDDVVFTEDGTIGVVSNVNMFEYTITILHEGDLDGHDDDYVYTSYDIEEGHLYKSSDVDGGSIYSDCVQVCDSGKLDSDMWGEQWWNEEEVTTSYVNFKVTRYEMSDGWGVEFYSTEGDTLRVFKSGDVHFKPAEAERTIVINELVEYDYEDDDRRRLVTSVHDLLAEINMGQPIKVKQLQDVRRRMVTGGVSQMGGLNRRQPHATMQPNASEDAEVGANLEDHRGMSLIEQQIRRLAKKRGMKTTGSFTLSKGR